MNWIPWIRRVFDRIVQEWTSSEEARHKGVAIAPKALFPELPHPQADAAIIYAYIDLEWLKLVEDPEVHNPTLAQLTDLGREAVEVGVARATLPAIRAKCAALSLSERRLLERLVTYVRAGSQPAEYAKPLAGRASQLQGGMGVEETDRVTWALSGQGMITREGVSDTHGRWVDFKLTPLYAGFTCVDHHWFGLPPNPNPPADVFPSDHAETPLLSLNYPEAQLRLSLEQFRQRITVIEGQEADRLRAAYIDRFVNTTSVYFRQHIDEHGPQGDEVCYTGYLWDTLKQGQVISQEDLLARLRQWDEVYVFWDLHNDTKIFIPNYWKFPLKAVLRLRSADLINVVINDWDTDQYETFILPQDIYIFTAAMDSSLILTHETDERRQRLCFEAS